MRDTERTIELQVIRVFRLFVGFYLALGVGLLAIYMLLLGASPPLIRVIGLGINGLLLAYLSFARLRYLLKSTYLPLALIVATAAPIIEQQMLYWWERAGGEITRNPVLRLLLRPDMAAYRVSGAAGAWFPVLFVPLVIIAWRYGLSAAVMFCAATAALDASLYLVLIGNEASGLFTFIFVGYVVARLTTNEREQRTLLQEQNRQLSHQTMTREMLAASRERNMVARELHDTLAHALSATSIQLDACVTLWDSNPQKARELAARSLEQVRTGLTETRRALAALRAAPLEDLGLLLALRQLAESFAERAGWQLALRLPKALPYLEPSLEQTLYRCAQEALTNIERHAAAKSVDLSLYTSTSIFSDGHQISLVITDDGCGFVLDEVDETTHFGLVSMNERLQTVGSLLAVSTTPGKGTTLIARVRTDGQSAWGRLDES